MFAKLFRNPLFQYAYLLSAIIFLAAVYYTSATELVPDSVLHILLIIHVLFLFMKLLAPALFNRLLIGTSKYDSTNSLNERTIPRRNPNDIYTLDAADCRYTDIERTLFNGITQTTIKTNKDWKAEEYSVRRSTNIAPYERKNYDRPEFIGGETFYSMDGVDRRCKSALQSSYIEQDYIRRMGEFSR